jgi:hypothetical protein
MTEAILEHFRSSDICGSWAVGRGVLFPCPLSANPRSEDNIYKWGCKIRNVSIKSYGYKSCQFVTILISYMRWSVRLSGF